MIAPLNSQKFPVSCDINLSQGWNQGNKGQTKRLKCAEPSWVSHQKFKSSFQSPWEAIIQHLRGNSSAGKSFRFTRTPTNASQHLPEPWTTSSVQLIEINLLDDLLEIMSWPHLFNYIIAPNSSSSVISSLYFSIATIYPADLFHCKLMLIRRPKTVLDPGQLHSSCDSSNAMANSQVQ